MLSKLGLLPHGEDLEEHHAHGAPPRGPPHALRPPRSNGGLQPQLLGELPPERLGERLPGLHLAPWELPAPLVSGALGSLRREATATVAPGRRHHQ